MRGWGFTFICVVIAAAFLPSPLDWYLLGAVSIVSIVSATTDYADARVRRELEAAKETANHREWTDQLKQMEVEDAAAWERLAAAIDLHPAPLIYPGRLRSVPIPSQRPASD